MVNRLNQHQCDPDRLRFYLDDELSPGEQAELASHLDHCGTCQKALERLAAGSRVWDNLRHLGGQADPSLTGSSSDDRQGRSWGGPKRRAAAMVSTSWRRRMTPLTWAVSGLMRSSAFSVKAAWASSSKRSTRR